MTVLQTDSTALTALGVSSIDASKHTATSTIGLLAGVHDEVVKLFVDFGEAVKHVRASNHLTSAGREASVQTLAGETIAQIEAYRTNGVLDQANRDLDKLDASLKRMPVPNARDAGRRVDVIDRRQFLRGLDPMEVRQVLFAAVEQGDRETFDAIVDAPAYMQMVDDDAKLQAEMMLAEKTAPEAVAARRELADAIKKVNTAIDRLTGQVRDHAGLRDDATPMVVLS